MKKIFLSILTIAVLTFFGLSCSPSTLNFAQLSDVHIPGTVDENNNPTHQELLLKDAISQINQIKNLDFTVITGDSVDSPNAELFTHICNIYNSLNMKWYYTLGNHDGVTWGFLPKTELLNILKQQNKDYKFDSVDYTVKPKRGFRLIFLDGTQDESGVNDANGHLSDEQLNFIDNTLAKSKNDTVIIFMHTPLYPPLDLPDHYIDNADALYNVLNKYKMPIAIFAGHYHATKIDRENNILHVASPSLRYGQSFRIVNVKNEKNKVTFNLTYKQTNINGNETDNERNRMPGEESDRNTTIIIDK